MFEYFTVSFVGISFIFFILDMLKLFPRLGSGKYPTLNKYINAVPNVVFNLFATHVIISILYPYIAQNNNMSYIQYIVSLFLSTILADIYFYFAHMLFHCNNFLYKSIHSQHHVYAEPFAFSGIECHILEHIFINICSAAIGPVIMSSFGLFNNNIFKIWTFVAAISSTTSHCGYTFLDTYHFDHHLYINKNYGIFPYFCDLIFGTLKVSDKQMERNKLLSERMT